LMYSIDSARPTALRLEGTEEQVSGWRSFAMWSNCTAALYPQQAPEKAAAPRSSFDFLLCSQNFRRNIRKAARGFKQNLRPDGLKQKDRSCEAYACWL